MNFKDSFRSLWQRLMIKNTAFNSRHSKLKMLYAISDPWNMSSKKEQARFRETNRLLASVAPKFDRLLELGCGEGHQTRYFESIAYQVYGVDISEKAVERARRSCPSVNFSVSSMEDIPKNLPEESFDIIIACEVLYYTDNIDLVLARCQKMAPVIFVSNYLERSVLMREKFSGDGWRRLDSIKHEDTCWECYLWQK